MSRFVRFRRRTAWSMALFPVSALGALAAHAVLFPPEPLLRERHPAPRDARRPDRAPVTSAAVLGKNASAAPSARRLEALPDPAAWRELALDRSKTPGTRSRALREAFARADSRICLSLALEVLDEAPGGTLECEALRLLGPAVAKAPERHDSCLRAVLRSLERTKEPEVALAGGAALDAIGGLNAADLGRGLDRCALPESRVALLRGLASQHSVPEAAVAFEKAIGTDPSPLVRQEAFLALAASCEDQELEPLHDALVRDAKLRRVLVRALAHEPGAAADRILGDAFEAESDALVARGLARALANRSESARSVLVAQAQGRDAHASLAAAVLVEASIGRTTK